MGNVVITGIGMISPLGNSPEEVLQRINANEIAANKPVFETSAFDCSVCASVKDFAAEEYFPDNKSLRLMNRDAQMAVVAANLAMADAKIITDDIYNAEDVALYGATGVAGMSVEEISRIIRYAANEDGTLNLDSFGKIALKKVRPVLSFRILANMPICFVSIFQNIKGPNAVFTPWEGHGAQAIATGIEAIKRGQVKCALVGGCDCKTRELSFINLQQLGVFDSWKQNGSGPIPAEGAAFLVLEDEQAAIKRGVEIYARIKDYRLGSGNAKTELQDTLAAIISAVKAKSNVKVIAASDGDIAIADSEMWALEQSGFTGEIVLKAKNNVGNLYAGASALQVGLAGQLANEAKHGEQFLANCFGFGTEQGAFLLESVCTE